MSTAEDQATAVPTTVPTKELDPAAQLRRNTDFNRLWFGEGVSVVGSQVTALALPMTAVLTLDASAEQVGVLRFLQMIPFLLFALPFGVLVDRSRRRPILLWTNLVRLVLIGSIPLAAVLGGLNIWLLFAVTFAVGVATVLFDVCYMSYVPVLVSDQRQLVVANGRLGATTSAAEATGPSLGGALVGLLTAPVTLALDAASYLVSVIALSRIRAREPVPTSSGPRRRLMTELVEGVSFVFRNRYLRAIALVGAACNFITAAILSLFMIYAVRNQGLEPALLGLILSTGAAGGIVGALLTGRLVRRFRLGWVYVGSLSLAFLGSALIPAVEGGKSTVVVLFIVAFFIIYVGIAAGNVLVLTLRQTITPRALLGRMNAAMRTLMIGFGAVGAPVGGVLGGMFGVRNALWYVSIAAIAMLVLVQLSPVGRLRQMPPPADEAPQAATTGKS